MIIVVHCVIRAKNSLGDYCMLEMKICICEDCSGKLSMFNW